MPLDRGAGYSEGTVIKQRDFTYVLGVLLRVAQSCMARSWAYPEFLYFDLNAGPGIVGGIEGSPLIFMRAALSMGLPFRAFFFEKDKASAYALRDALESVCPQPQRDRLRVVHGDHTRGVDWKLTDDLSGLPSKWVYGLAYGDGNGRTDAPFTPMAALAERFSQVDLLLNVNATVYKRERGAKPEAGFLLDGIGSIKKAHRLIREPVGIHQWTMLFQTNWIGAPEFEQIGFRRLNSDEGREIAARVNFSKREIERPFVLRRPIGPTPNTFAIRDSSLSAPSSSSGVAASVSGATSPVPLNPIT